MDSLNFDGHGPACDFFSPLAKDVFDGGHPAIVCAVFKPTEMVRNEMPKHNITLSKTCIQPERRRQEKINMSPIFTAGTLDDDNPMFISMLGEPVS